MHEWSRTTYLLEQLEMTGNGEEEFFLFALLFSEGTFEMGDRVRASIPGDGFRIRDETKLGKPCRHNPSASTFQYSHAKSERGSGRKRGV